MAEQAPRYPPGYPAVPRFSLRGAGPGFGKAGGCGCGCQRPRAWPVEPVPVVAGTTATTAPTLGGASATTSTFARASALLAEHHEAGSEPGEIGRIEPGIGMGSIRRIAPARKIGSTQRSGWSWRRRRVWEPLLSTDALATANDRVPRFSPRKLADSVRFVRFNIVLTLTSATKEGGMDEKGRRGCRPVTEIGPASPGWVDVTTSPTPTMTQGGRRATRSLRSFVKKPGNTPGRRGTTTLRGSATRVSLGQDNDVPSSRVFRKNLGSRDQR